MKFLILFLFASVALAQDLPDGLYLELDPDDVHCVGDACDPVDPPPTGAPEAVDDIFIYDSLDEVCGPGTNVLDNDISPLGLPLKAEHRQGEGPWHGNLALHEDGTCTYSRYPQSDDLGDHFGYYAWNETEGYSEKAMVHFRWGEDEVPPPIDPCEEDPTLPECQPPVNPEWPPVTYQPDFPPLGEYSVPGMCQPVQGPGDVIVTMQDGDTLQGAFESLRSTIETRRSIVLAAATESLNAAVRVSSWNQVLEAILLLEWVNSEAAGGGVIEIPWDLATVECDALRVNDNMSISGPLTIKGLPGPNGQQPRFYCRAEDRDGTLPRGSVVGQLFNFPGVRDSFQSIVVENIHGDGYKTFMLTPKTGLVVMRNNYGHHGLSDGVANSNNATGEYGLNLQMCGNEISHYGQGNTIHNTYNHRSLGGDGGSDILDGDNASWNRLDYIDNVCHSSYFSHCLKSTANENNVVGSQFYSQRDTDPTYTQVWGSGLIDLTQCAINTIRNNLLHADKPVANKGGKYIIDLRNRRTILRGCDLPFMYGPDIPPTKIDGPAHTEEYWAGMMGTILFPTIIEDNIFKATGDFGFQKRAINARGTYPNNETTLGSPSCWLEAPDNWYERSRIYVDNNTYINMSSQMDGLYYDELIGHNYHGDCPTGDTPPPGPGPYPWKQQGSPWDPNNTMIEVGPNETMLDD